MTNDDSPDESRHEDLPADDDQYAALTTGQGDTIVYDRHNPDAWIQSTFAVDVGACESDGTSA